MRYNRTKIASSHLPGYGNRHGSSSLSHLINTLSSFFCHDGSNSIDLIVLPFDLLAPQFRIHALPVVRREQLRVRAPLDYSAFVEHVNHVRVDDGRQAVRDGEGRASL